MSRCVARERGRSAWTRVRRFFYAVVLGFKKTGLSLQVFLLAYVLQI